MSARTTHSRPSRQARRDASHPVQFYAKETVMLEQVARFMRPGLEAGEAGLVIATPAHADALRARLGSLPCTFFDAQSTLDAFLRDGRIDAELFEAVVGQTVRDAARKGNGRVRAFGEMVALLAQQGRHGVALELEALWNRLIGGLPLTLLCAYPMSVFNGPAGSASLADLCATHDEVQAPPSPEEATAKAQLPARDDMVWDFVENGPIGMHQVDGDGTILWANRFELDLLGYSREEYVGRNVRDFHADPRAVDEIFEAIGAGHDVLAKRSALRRKDGTLLPALISSNGVVHDGKLVRSRCIVRPIEDVVALEASQQQTLLALTLRERQQAMVARIGHLALSARSLDDFFGVVCRELAAALQADSCGILECIEGADDLQFRAGHGFPPGFAPRVPGNAGSHSRFVLDSGKPVVYADLSKETRFIPGPKLLAVGVRSGMSAVIPVSTGAWGTIGVHCRQPRAFNRDDVNFLEAVAHVVGAAVERRMTEQALQRNQERLEAVVGERTSRLEQANRELDAFTSAVSHDLRGPVRAIAGFSALLAQRHAGRLDPHGRELLEEVRRAAARMGDLIEDLLDLSRADRALPNRAVVDLSALASEILRAEAERNPARHVHCDVEPDLVVQGDPDLLRMAMENLLANAWKFTSRTPDARISVSKRREGEEVVLCVQDNGAGFDMADAGRLFQPFQRLHSRNEFDGTGIGLATVRRIIERHGGRIWVQAKPGAGAAFYFTLQGPA